MKLKKKMQWKPGDFILVKYNINKRNCMYIGHVFKDNHPLFDVNFLKRKSN